MTSASMVSSSRSIRSIFFLMACSAASEQSAARSAPTWPWVSLATYTPHTHRLGSQAHACADCHTESRRRKSFHRPAPGQRRQPVSCSWCGSEESLIFRWHRGCRCPLPCQSGLHAEENRTRVRFHQAEQERHQRLENRPRGNNSPNLLSAGSMLLGLLVAAMTMT